MDVLIEIVAPIALFFVTMAVGLPIAFALGIAGAVGLLLTLGLPATLGILETLPFRTTASYTLTTVAMFVLMAEFATQSGITQRLFDAANRFLGHFRGGLAVATIIASAAFGAISGSSVAAAATMAGIAIPQMRQRGYSRTFAAGVVGIAGTLAIMIPPSLPLIIYGIITETSIGRLLLSGIVPGILTALGYVVTVRVCLALRPEMAPERQPKASWRERWESSRMTWPFLVTVVAVFACLYTGVITATEAGAIGAAVVLLVWLVGARIAPRDTEPVTIPALKQALDRSLRITTMIVVLLIGAYMFSYYLTATGVTHSAVDLVTGLDVNRYVLLAAIIVLYIVLGLFLSQLEIMVLTLPLVFPIVTSLGFDAVWFGVMVVKTVEIGLVTPPVGMNIYVVSSAAPQVTPSDGFKGVAPFLVMEVLLIVLLVAFPEIATFIPNHAGL